MRWKLHWLALAIGALWALGVAGCIVGALLDVTAFQRAWLCSFVFWLGLPLAGVALVLVHDLSGGDWMATARPVLNGAIATMPLASLAGIPAFVGLHSLYSWTHPAPGLANLFYLNPTDFFIRYGAYVIVWNLLAAFALWGPREGKLPVSSSLSWISGIGLIVLALSASFAAVDWILSLDPTFWSSAFPYGQAASWFNTGMAMAVLIVALFGWPAGRRRQHMADLARILLATTIFWAYVEYCQFLIVWEENLRSEIPWYLHRFAGSWEAVLYTVAGAGFFIPFFVLVWTPSKRNRGIVAAVCALIFLAQLIHVWWLVLPDFPDSGFGWLDVAAFFALGGLMMSAFLWRLRYGQVLLRRAARPAPEALHG